MQVAATPFSVACPTPGCRNPKGGPQFLKFVTGLSEDGVVTAWASCRFCKETRCPFGHRMVEVWVSGISSYNSKQHDIKVCVDPGGCQRRFNEMTESAEEFRYRNRGARAQELLKMWRERARGSRNWRDVQAQMMVNLWVFWNTPEPVKPAQPVSQKPAKTDQRQVELTVDGVLAMLPAPASAPQPPVPVQHEPLSVDGLAEALFSAPPGIDREVAMDALLELMAARP